MVDSLNKVLLIAGDDTCFNALNEFAISFEKALKERGYESEILYVNMLDQGVLDKLISEQYLAIVGFQTNLFSLEISQGVYVGNLISSPKYNYIFDSPITKRDYFIPHIDNMTMFYHDIGYVDYLKEYFPHINAIYFPPAGGTVGFEKKEGLFDGERKYDVTFMGTYINYRDILKSAVSNNPDWAGIMLDFFDYLVKNPNIGAIKGIKAFVEDNSIDVKHEEIPALLEILYPAENAVKSYYRERVIKTLLDEDISVDVFSESWENTPFANHKKLSIHHEISYKKSMDVISDSKLSLNVFSWHKDSMTERIANIMLGGAVCVSDWSGKLNRIFNNDEEIVIFKLEELELLPVKVKYLLENSDERKMIAQAGYKNAYAKHRWINRVDDFINML